MSESLVRALQQGRATAEQQREAARIVEDAARERAEYRKALLEWCLMRRDQTVELTERALVMDWEDA